jgi:dephospho-CoA kinase
MHKMICLVGMPGSGKSEVAEYLRKKNDLGYVRFGQVVLDEIIKEGGKTTEQRERKIREALRKKHGMAAIALLNMDKFDREFEKGDFIGDAIYSWEEYLLLKEKYKNNLVLIGIYASPKVRYERLSGRSQRHGKDNELRYRSFSNEESVARDYAEIDNLHKAGPIVMADYMIINEGSVDELNKKVDEVFEKIYDGDKL